MKEELNAEEAKLKEKEDFKTLYEQNEAKIESLTNNADKWTNYQETKSSTLDKANMLNEIQKSLFTNMHEKLHLSLLIEVLEGIIEFKSLNEELQLEVLEITNACYRAKHELINDRVYDGFQEIFKESNELGEYHPYLTNVESEDVIEENSMNDPSTSTEPEIEDNNQDLSEETDKSES